MGDPKKFAALQSMFQPRIISLRTSFLIYTESLIAGGALSPILSFSLSFSLFLCVSLFLSFSLSLFLSTLSLFLSFSLSLFFFLRSPGF